MSHTRKGKLGCNVESSRLIIDKRRSKSPKDLSASSIATLVDGRGRFLRMDFCRIDFNTGTYISESMKKRQQIYRTI